VLVVDYKGMVESGPWGDLMTTSALARGVAGLVIDGCVRDAQVIRGMGFPVFSRGVCMKGTTKVATDGDVNLPVTCGGVVVAPGDIVVADDDGVVVVPLATAAETLAKARERTAREEELRVQLEAGRTTIELLKLEGYLKAAGIEL
jgi:4-hydroxy-4-methyl-2-oxoglutarate aldolase